MRKIRSPQTTGELCPRPGSFFFQRTLDSSLHLIGGSAVGDSPVRNGPRQRDHVSGSLANSWGKLHVRVTSAGNRSSRGRSRRIGGFALARVEERCSFYVSTTRTAGKNLNGSIPCPWAGARGAGSAMRLVRPAGCYPTAALSSSSASCFRNVAVT